MPAQKLVKLPPKHRKYIEYARAVVMGGDRKIYKSALVNSYLNCSFSHDWLRLTSIVIPEYRIVWMTLCSSILVYCVFFFKVRK
jgi:hypothetical protein